MNRIRWFAVLILLAVIGTAANPFSVLAFDNIQKNGSVTASAVIVPTQVSRIGFLITSPVKEIAVNKGDTVTAGQTLITLNTPDLEYAVLAADAAYRSAEAYAALQRYKKVWNFINGKEVWQDAPPEIRQRADAQALSAFSRLEIAQANLAQGTLVAPYDATVVSIDAFVGETAQQGQPVIVLATLNNMIVETTDLSERDVLKVKVGAPASIVIKSLNETFQGKVTGIAPQATTIGGDVVFKVTITFDEQPENILWGMTAEVTIN